MAKKPSKKAPARTGKSPKASRPAAEKKPVTRNTTGDGDSGQLPFTTVAIGASAGGLQAFTDLLRHLPNDTGMSFVFVQHLHPKHVSILAELLSRETKMKVLEVKDGARVEPNKVYVIPRNTVMCMENGLLRVMPRPSRPVTSMPIDIFFESLGRDQGNRSIGIVLSGTDSDGASGLRAIKAAGGITFAQIPSSANFDGMPRNAISSGQADIIGSPSEIAAELVRLSKHPVPVHPAAEEHAEEDAAALDGTEDDLLKVLTLVRQATGVDFQLYKRSTLRRRIARRLMLNRIETLKKYCAFVKTHPTELTALYEDILINVTEFFRDPDVFDSLKITVFPRILQEKRRQSPIRIWVPGCSTGEEVYSLAIALLETLGDHPVDVPIHLFATDISEMALQRARAGIYPETAIREISEERLRRFFTRQEGGYQVSKRIREMCIFARQNVAKDPPFSKLDLISCRNVLIYLGPTLQKRVIPIFHYALRPNGYLLLGSSEGIGSFSEMFTLVDKKSKIYMRKSVPVRAPLDFAIPEPESPISSPATQAEPWTDLELQREADRLLVAKYAHSGVIIDQDQNILQFRGNTTPYLRSAPGVASLNLLKMSREGLMVELRNATQKAQKTQRVVRREDLRVSVDGTVRNVSLEVIPFRRQNAREQRYLVVFEEVPKTRKRVDAKAQAKPRTTTTDALLRENEQLRQDVQATQEYLQSIIEEHEASNEELRSANEEILSANEELQSTNEELETAKEELQSANEELSTVNEELQNRNQQLTQTTNDLVNLLSNVNIPIVMVGIDLRIRRFTPISERLLNLIPTDVGRPITDIKFNIDIPDLAELLLSVIKELTPKVIELRDWNGRPYSLRLRPYRTDENKIDGVVLLLVDLDPAQKGPDGATPVVQTNPEFASMLIAAQEEERRRLAREIHDELNQRLALLEVNAEMIERRPDLQNGGGKDQLQLFRKQVAELSNDVRRIAYRLHPTIVEDLGLETALRSHIAELAQRDNIKIRASIVELPKNLRPSVGTAVYRIAQEALLNVLKHARGATVDLSVRLVGEKLTMRIKDNGPGFNREVTSKGLGLTAMEERARSVGGIARIRSAEGNGTEILVELPTTFP